MRFFFAFCFGLREGMLMLAALLALAATVWLSNWLGAAPHDFASLLSIGLLVVNAVLAATTVKRESERLALALVVTFGLLLAMLLVNFAVYHPAACANQDVEDSHPLGRFLARLIWAPDACLLCAARAPGRSPPRPRLPRPPRAPRPHPRGALLFLPRAPPALTPHGRGRPSAGCPSWRG